MIAAAPDHEDRAGRGPGRPRVEGLDDRILAATLELLDAGEQVTVTRIVQLSRVSRAALYRRWPSVTDLVAAALDQGRTSMVVPTDGNLREAVLTSFLGGADTVRTTYREERIRQRLRLALSDRALQQAYWSSHVSRRRVPVENALRVGIERGELRDDVDIAACFDLMAGVFYYQLVVRGAGLDEPGTVARCRAALDVVWRGMAVR
ncbi:TetR/AcrR family transcriptional regulator [Georgenia alba]|uniref:TetR/AcrR family transcriptional regulator C-terminal ligand-binding domain-containing protein n=1 Tax=Georgenia alba TaxID=2233858 RepID=A0ABW2Q2X0_9MICO